MGEIPHIRIVLWVSFLAILGYGGFSLWVVIWSGDTSLRGDVIGTWKSFAVLAFGFWIGSSSGGKSAAAGPSGTRENPLSVEGAAEGARPVNVKEGGNA